MDLRSQKDSNLPERVFSDLDKCPVGRTPGVQGTPESLKEEGFTWEGIDSDAVVAMATRGETHDR
jgi:hypothetical protein